MSDTPENVTGAVMVVGGGIAGMQASLDLAEQGYRVYLVERQSAIGGHMAKLDKTFPTNDCAMCIISPKLVETGRHLNINLLVDTEVTKVEGQLSGKTSNITKQTILILAALNIVNENFELKKNHSDFLRDVSKRTTSLIRVLSENIQ